MSYFIFNGKSSKDFGVRIQSKNIYSAPKYDVTLITIPGRNGELVSSNGRFPNVTVSYTCYLPAKSIAELGEKMTAIKNWLYKAVGEYHDLTDSYDEKFIRKALFNTKLDIADECRKIGTFTVSFSCKPFRYLKSGLTISAYTVPFTLQNPFSFNSKPYLRINGKGKGTLTINNKLWSFETLNGYTECDSELMNFYHDTVLKNDTVTGEGFPELEPGENNVSFDGGIVSVQVMPRWCTL